VAKYVALAEAEGLALGLGRTAEEWRDMVAGWFPTVVDGRLRQISWPEFDTRIDWVLLEACHRPCPTSAGGRSNGLSLPQPSRRP
jgi:hypothetical protein